MGHAYVTYGPLIFPSVLFGTELPVTAGVPFTLGFEVGSVAGLKEVQLIGDGKVHETRSLPAAPLQARTDFSLTAVRAGWYSLIVVDQAGRKAYTDPIWITPGPARCAAGAR